ncbi:DUF3597 family protein [Roseomonas aerophila]|uniref:DUF3597 family protein n=1 Tax=Teichococcus aerophilus TaxID=1224513 RepID=A0ABR7RGR8_9PROT|nr:DUF3597 domain-containing protein [Pseudoroseomonas aerophila]MBC9205759.1 DUF3597 family protein [Pseudoroseomonas aerophila]
MSIFGAIVSKVFHPPLPPGADVIAILHRAALDRPIIEKLNWGQSIVDLLKLLNLDSGPDTRRALALELRYSGDPNDMLHMNTWLHREVMARLARAGVQPPLDPRH